MEIQQPPSKTRMRLDALYHLIDTEQAGQSTLNLELDIRDFQSTGQPLSQRASTSLGRDGHIRDG